MSMLPKTVVSCDCRPELAITNVSRPYGRGMKLSSWPCLRMRGSAPGFERSRTMPKARLERFVKNRQPERAHR